ncbi:CoA transferase [Pseudomonas sp. NCHU5208]|uniref:CoA transferase n=1 Tax=unclassified Pseudomonas TaxID=196821 RepID=UPI003F9DD221
MAIRPLNGVSLWLAEAPQGLQATREALALRMRRLGVQVRQLEGERSQDGQLVARLEGAGGAQVSLHVRGWPSGSQPASEVLAQAACGLTGWHARSAGGVFALGVDYLSVLTASLACSAGVAALLGQCRGSGSQAVHLSLGGAGVLAMAQYLAMDDAGQVLPVPGAHDWLRPPFTSGDGVRFELEALDPEAWRRFWEGLGVPMVDIAAAWPPFMQRYTTATAWLPPALFQACARHRLADLGCLARDAGVSLCALRLAPAPSQPDGPWAFDEPLPASVLAPAASGAAQPLAGLAGLEACRLIQGPLAGHLLRELGMQITRIEPPGGDPMRGMAPLVGGLSVHFQAINRGKAWLEVDLRSEAGRARLGQLLGGCDAFLHNWAPGRAERLGLTPEVLRRHAPGLVYASASGSGRHPAADDPLGTDFMIQAHSGLAACIQQHDRPAGALLTLVDVLGGAALAEGVVAALYQRHVHGRSSALDSSMAGAAGLLLASANAPAGLVLGCADGQLLLDGGSPREVDGLAHLASAAALAHLAERGIPASRISRCAADVGAHPWLAGALSRDEYGLRSASPWIIN